MTGNLELSRLINEIKNVKLPEINLARSGKKKQEWCNNKTEKTNRIIKL